MNVFTAVESTSWPGREVVTVESTSWPGRDVVIRLKPQLTFSLPSNHYPGRSVTSSRTPTRHAVAIVTTQFVVTLGAAVDGVGLLLMQDGNQAAATASRQHPTH